MRCRCFQLGRRIWQIPKQWWKEVAINFDWITKRPLSLLTAILAVFLIVNEAIQIASGNLYQAVLNNMDRTTLVELGILTLVGVFTLRDYTDLQAVSFTLVCGLSFIFVYEAIYKWSFFWVPFDQDRSMPPAEIRGFVIQIGIAATVLTGFAEQIFALKEWTFFWLGLFVILWVFWQLVGIPQITGEVIFPKIIPIDFTYDMTYVLNRATKAVMCFFFAVREIRFSTK